MLVQHRIEGEPCGSWSFDGLTRNFRAAASATGRLDRRLRQLVARLDAGFGESIPLACQDLPNTEAAYRFFSNDRVSEEEIRRVHLDATRRR